MAQVHQRIPVVYLVPGISRGLSCVGIRRVTLLRAMCGLIPVPRERNAKGACCSHLLIMIPTNIRVPGSGVDGHAKSWSQLPECQLPVSTDMNLP